MKWNGLKLESSNEKGDWKLEAIKEIRGQSLRLLELWLNVVIARQNQALRDGSFSVRTVNRSLVIPLSPVTEDTYRAVFLNALSRNVFHAFWVDQWRLCAGGLWTFLGFRPVVLLKSDLQCSKTRILPFVWPSEFLAIPAALADLPWVLPVNASLSEQWIQADEIFMTKQM